MSNAPCNHVGAICVIGNFWNCAECEVRSRSLRHLAKSPSFSLMESFTVAAQETEVPGQVLVEMTVHDATMAAIVEHGLKPLDMSAIRLAKVEPDAGPTWWRYPDYGLPDAVVINFRTLKNRT